MSVSSREKALNLSRIGVETKHSPEKTGFLLFILKQKHCCGDALLLVSSYPAELKTRLEDQT